MRILFIIPDFKIGGTNKVLLSVLKILQFSHCETAIFSINHNEDPLDIKGNYYVLPEFPLKYLSKSVKTALKDFDVREIVKVILYRITRRWGKFSLEDRLLIKTGKDIEKYGYDVIVGMEEGIATKLASYVTAKNMIAWIHCDYSRYHQMINNYNESPIYEKYDSIVCVSEYTSKVFKNTYKNLAHKVRTIYNPLDVEYIIKKSFEHVDHPFLKKEAADKHILISMGRFDPVKRFDYIPEIAFELKKMGLKFVWYIVGDGIEKSLILDNTVKFGVQNEIVLTGFITNPYPLLKKSDALIVLSKSEACPIVIHEAMILQTPVISTDYPTAYEFIENNYNGIIASINEIAYSIFNTINNLSKYSQIKKVIEKFRYNNDIMSEKILALFSDHLNYNHDISMKGEQSK